MIKSTIHDKPEDFHVLPLFSGRSLPSEMMKNYWKKKPLTCIIPWIISATYVTYGFSIQHGMLTICQTLCPTPTYQFISQQRHIKNNACEFLSGARVGWVETGICGREWDPSETSGSTSGSGTSGLFWITCSVIWVQLGLPPLKLEWLSRRNKYGSGSPV